MHTELFGFDVEIDASVLDSDESTLREHLDEYRNGDRTAFDAPVAFPDGLTGDVMRAMRRIPYGETRTYGDIAADLGTSPVAVGQACGRNPVPIVVPCHRVVGADSLGGFSADGGVALKRRLLDHEAATAATHDGIASGEASTPTVQTRLD